METRLPPTRCEGTAPPCPPHPSARLTPPCPPHPSLTLCPPRHSLTPLPTSLAQPNLKIPGQLRHGEGEIRYESGSEYTGHWEDDKRNGPGKFTFACGDVYEGTWKANMYHGHGKYSSAETDEYEGQWCDDKMHGHGKYLFRVQGDLHEASPVPAAALLPAPCPLPPAPCPLPPAPFSPPAHNCYVSPDGPRES